MASSVMATSIFGVMKRNPGLGLDVLLLPHILDPNAPIVNPGGPLVGDVNVDIENEEARGVV